MGFSTRVTLVALAVLLLGGGEARAYCIGQDQAWRDYDPNYYSVATEFRRAQYVARIKVTGETWLGEDGKPKPLAPPFQYDGPRPWGFDPYLGAWYDGDVLEVFKGKPGKSVRLFSENSTARFWLDVGGEWVVFVSAGDFERPVGEALTIDTCGNSRRVEKAGDVLRELKSLALPGRERMVGRVGVEPTTY